MASAGHVQTLLTCAKAQERRAMLPDGFSVGYFRLSTRLRVLGPFLLYLIPLEIRCEVKSRSERVKI